jgi:hypothetical protein
LPTQVAIHSISDSQGRRIAEYNETSGALIREYVWNGWDPIAASKAGWSLSSAPTTSAARSSPPTRPE